MPRFFPHTYHLYTLSLASSSSQSLTYSSGEPGPSLAKTLLESFFCRPLFTIVTCIKIFYIPSCRSTYFEVSQLACCIHVLVTGDLRCTVTNSR